MHLLAKKGETSLMIPLFKKTVRSPEENRRKAKEEGTRPLAVVVLKEETNHLGQKSGLRRPTKEGIHGPMCGCEGKKKVPVLGSPRK